MKPISKRGGFSLIEVIVVIAVIALLAFGTSARAQTATSVNSFQISGTVFQFQGQNFLITTNQSGGLEVMTFGVQGTNVVTVPANADQAMAVASAWIGKNNPANIGFYGTNEIEARLFAGYLQSSGSAVAGLGLIKWGLIKSAPNIGPEAGVLQGNAPGKPGTAAVYGGLVYRRPIGDVAFECGGDAGYDLWDSTWFVAPFAGLTYRQSNYLGEFIRASYAFEPKSKTDKGTFISGGVTYTFD